MIITKYEIFYFLFVMMCVLYIILGSRLIYTKDYRDLKQNYLHYDNINTGDLFLVSYSNVDTITSNSMMGLKFTHASICSREGSNLYIYELANYFEEITGFIKIPFSEWLKYNKNTLILHNKLNIVNDNNIKRTYLSVMFNDFRKKHMTSGVFNMVDFSLRYMNPEKQYSHLDFNEKNYACYEVVLSMMKDSGIIKDMKSTENYTTEDMIGMKNFNLRPAFSYEDYYICDIESLIGICD